MEIFFFSYEKCSNFYFVSFYSCLVPRGKIDFIQALDKSSSDDDFIWAMDADGLSYSQQLATEIDLNKKYL